MKVNCKYTLTGLVRGVVPGGAGGAMAPPDFGRSVNPFSIKGGKLCPPNDTGTLGFYDLPTALLVRKALLMRKSLRQNTATIYLHIKYAST